MSTKATRRIKSGMSYLDIAKIAEQITDYLFTNGAGQKAQRLVLEMPDRRNGGGWGREPMLHAILEQLETALKNAPPVDTHSSRP